MNISFDVTENHIADGMCGDMNRCVVALALLNKGYKSVCVSNYFIAFRKDDETWICNPLPLDISQFIRSFDRGRAFVVPTSFTLEVTQRMGE